MLQFMRNLIGVKADKAVQAGVDALVRWDPQSASEAEMRSMEQHLDELGQQVARARQSYDKETREAEAIQTLSTQRMAAAEHLQAQVAAETDPAKKAELERSLSTLVTMLEQMAPEVDREKKDVVDAKEFLEMLEKTYADAGGKLREGRSQLERAQRDMARAGQQRQMAEQQADAARRAAGLGTTTSGLNVALRSMQDAAARDLANAESANMKAKLLTPTQPEKDDANIADAMRIASGKGAAPTSLTDRRCARTEGSSARRRHGSRAPQSRLVVCLGRGQLQQHDADRGDSGGEAGAQQDVWRLPALRQQETAQSWADDTAKPADAQRPTDAGVADARRVFRGGEPVRTQLTADHAYAHDEDGWQQYQVGQVAEGDRRDDDDPASQAGGEHAICPERGRHRSEQQHTERAAGTVEAGGEHCIGWREAFQMQNRGQPEADQVQAEQAGEEHDPEQHGAQGISVGEQCRDRIAAGHVDVLHRTHDGGGAGIDAQPGKDAECCG
jgi:hypothetical protein